jgi:transposase
MRTIREILRLKWASQRSNREIAQSCKIARSSVGECLARAAAAGITWPVPPELDDGTLEARLYRRPGRLPGQRPLPDWATIHQELKRPGVTLQLLWQEYKAGDPAGLQYSQFCVHYRAWAKTLDLCLRQEHRAGEKLFLDYAGASLWLTDPATGTRTPVALFVAVLGASNYTYAEATRAADLPSWIGSHVRAFEYLGGVPALLIPDFVPGHKIGILCPTPLCGHRDRRGRAIWSAAQTRAHNHHRDLSQASSDSSLCQTGLRGNAAEEPAGGSQSWSAASFARRLSSA